MSAVDLARALLPDATELHAYVAEALDDPEGFVTKHQRSLAQRGIRKPVPKLAVLALIDALIERELATELDWKEDPGDALAQVFALASLPSRTPVSGIAEPDLDEDTACFDALIAADAALAPHGLLVVTFDIDSDSHPTLLVDAAAYEAIIDVARKSGIAVDRVS